MLSALADDRLEDFLRRIKPPRLTPFTVTSKRELRRAIIEARNDGYALVDQEAEVGFRSVAVPVRRYDGATIAALNVGVHIEQATVERMTENFLPQLSMRRSSSSGS